MSAGERQTKWLRGFVVHATLLLVTWFGSTAFAIDNPDARDLIAEFESRSQPYVDAIVESGQSHAETAHAYSAYEQFLDNELNQSYRELLERLDEQPRRDLIASQKRWLQFRDAEFRFVDSNWVPARFGSSYQITRGASRTHVLRNRVMDLLLYLKNYRSAG